MRHGGDVYTQKVNEDFSVSLNPKPCPVIVHKTGERALKKADQYPDIEQTKVRKILAQLEGLSTEEIFCGNGASELIMAAIKSINPKECLLVSPGFYGYRHCLQNLECRITSYELKEDADFRLGEDFCDYITEEVDLVILANPNNPTGKLIGDDLILRIFKKCKACNAKLLMDECFLALSDKGKSMTEYIHEYSGLYIIKAYTKLFSIPGIRFGYIMSQADNIGKLIQYLPEWNVSVIAQNMAVTATNILMNSSFRKDSLDIIKTERQYLENELNLLGIKTYLSDANFILFRCEESFNGRDLYRALLDEKILIRSAGDFQGLTDGYYRIAVKNHAANEKLVNAVKRIYADRTC